MAPNGDDTSQSSSIFTLFAESWSLIASFAASCSFIGLVFFLLGLIGILSSNSGNNKYTRDWIFLFVGILFIALSISLFSFCRIGVIKNERRRRQHLSASPRAVTNLPTNRRQRHCATQPSGRRQPLPIWSVDAIDRCFTPPPTYAEALQSGSQLPSIHNPGLRPPPYTVIKISQNTEL